MTNLAKSFLRDESAAVPVEYGLIASLVSVAAIGALSAMGTLLDGRLFAAASSLLDDVVANIPTTP